MDARELLTAMQEEGLIFLIDDDQLIVESKSPLVIRQKAIIERHRQEFFRLVKAAEPEAKPLTDEELANLITREAHRAGLLPADLWRFLAEDDIGAIRTGEPGEIAALRAFAASRGHTMDKTEGGHALPFPGTLDFITPGENQS